MLFLMIEAKCLFRQVSLVLLVKLKEGVYDGPVYFTWCKSCFSSVFKTQVHKI